jgi:hypothetical protein
MVRYVDYRRCRLQIVWWLLRTKCTSSEVVLEIHTLLTEEIQILHREDNFTTSKIGQCRVSTVWGHNLRYFSPQHYQGGHAYDIASTDGVQSEDIKTTEATMDGTSFHTSDASGVCCLSVTDLAWYALIVQLLTFPHLLVCGTIDMVFTFIEFLQVISQCCRNRFSAAAASTH